MRKLIMLLGVGFVAFSCIKPTVEQQLQKYLNERLDGITYEVLSINEVDSAFSPYESLVQAKYIIETALNDFNERYHYIMLEDVTQRYWKKELRTLITQTDEVIQKAYNDLLLASNATQESDEHRQKNNRLAFRATLKFEGKEQPNIFYLTTDGHKIGHSMLDIQRRMQYIREQMLQWKQLKKETEHDLDFFNCPE